MSDLIRIGDVERAIAKAVADGDLTALRQWRDRAKALCEYLRAQRASLPELHRVARAKLAAERGSGSVLERAVSHTGGRPNARNNGQKNPRSARGFPRVLLKELGVKEWESSVWQLLASVPEDVFARYCAECEADGTEITQAGLLKLASGSRPANWSSESIEWYTPAAYVNAARDAMGGIDLDPASSAKANQTVGAAQFLTRRDDGLARPWHGRVWLNPPYGETDGESSAGLWAAHLLGEYRAGRVASAVLLVNAVTDRAWFQPLWDFSICFTDHRIEFYTPHGQPQSPTYGNALVYFGPDVSAFARRFAEFGAVVGRIAP